MTISRTSTPSHAHSEMNLLVAVLMLTGIFYALIWWLGTLGGAVVISTLVVFGGAFLLVKAKGRQPVPAAD